MKKIIVFLLVTTIGSIALAQEGQEYAAGDAMSKILGEYLKIQEALATDSNAAIRASIHVILKLSLQLRGDEKKLAKEIAKATGELSLAKDITEEREAFKNLSAPIVDWVKIQKPKNVEVVFCSMAKASWVQKRGQVKNPYTGKSMQSCGEKAS